MRQFFPRLLRRFHYLIAQEWIFEMLQTNQKSINNFLSYDYIYGDSPKKTPCINNLTTTPALLIC